MNLDNRVKQLEKHKDTTETKPWLVVVYDGAKKPSDTALDKAKADYKAKHPDWQGRDYNVISVVSEKGKGLLERVLAGERT